jgi:hypothetical protein
VSRTGPTAEQGIAVLHQSQRYWNGNLKKYGINSQNKYNRHQQNCHLWILTETDYDQRCDPPSEPPTALQDFRPIILECGLGRRRGGGRGVGGKLVARNLSANPRKYIPSGNKYPYRCRYAFTTANINRQHLMLCQTTQNSLINFIHGFDAYDEDGNGTQQRRGKIVTLQFSWRMADWVISSTPNR